MAHDQAWGHWCPHRSFLWTRGGWQKQGCWHGTGFTQNKVCSKQTELNQSPLVVKMGTNRQVGYEGSHEALWFCHTNLLFVITPLTIWHIQFVFMVLFRWDVIVSMWYKKCIQWPWHALSPCGLQLTNPKLKPSIQNHVKFKLETKTGNAARETFLATEISMQDEIQILEGVWQSWLWAEHISQGNNQNAWINCFGTRTSSTGGNKSQIMHWEYHQWRTDSNPSETYSVKYLVFYSKIQANFNSLINRVLQIKIKTRFASL